MAGETTFDLRILLVREDVFEIHTITTSTQNVLQNHYANMLVQQVTKWLSPPDTSMNYNKALQQRHECTGQWFLDSDSYSKWKATPNSLLWLYGIPGCGKTILSSIIIEDLKKNEDISKSLLYFYFDFNDTRKKSLDKAIRSLMLQLYYKNENAQACLNSLYSSCKDDSSQPSIEVMCTTFETMAHMTGEVWIVLDALDECQTRNNTNAGGLLNWIKSCKSSQRSNLHLIVMSRPEYDIKEALKECTDNQVPLQSASVTKDIRSYVRARVRQQDGLKRWRQRIEIQDEIETRLMEKANGM